MKVSLIHPTRSRPQKSFDNSTAWMTFSNVPTELIVSVDSSDPKLSEYQKLYAGLLINDNTCVVEATNKAAAAARGDILLYLSDDFRCFGGWGKVIVEEFQKYTGPVVLKVDDMLQPFRNGVLTIPIMNRAAYDKLGYFYHPGYKSMWVDVHLYYRATKLGMLKYAPHIKFEHAHVSVGKAENDETYKRSAAHWQQGQDLFEKHKKMGFSV